MKDLKMFCFLSCHEIKTLWAREKLPLQWFSLEHMGWSPVFIIEYTSTGIKICPLSPASNPTTGLNSQFSSPFLLPAQNSSSFICKLWESTMTNFGNDWNCHLLNMHNLFCEKQLKISSVPLQDRTPQEIFCAHSCVSFCFVCLILCF